MYLFLAVWAELIPWCGRPSFVALPYVKRVFLETLKRIYTNFLERQISTFSISFWFLTMRCFFIFVNMAPIWKWKFQNATPTVMILIQRNLFFWNASYDSRQKLLKAFWHFKFNLKKRFRFIIVASGKWKWQLVRDQSGILDSCAVVTHTGDTTNDYMLEKGTLTF